ncbi:MAG: hypothetical protein R3350_06590 [Saprospiraceae bacterium]|nr:hypothetical protein [Saprospiraceae bacterium]
MQTITSPESLNDRSRVWIYHSDRPLSDEETASLRETLKVFARQWVSHNRQLKAFAEVYYNRFVVLMVDETEAGASGCSIDASVKFLKSVQSELGIDLFNRMIFSYLNSDNEVVSVDRQEFASKYRDGEINDGTLVFDTLVDQKSDFDRHLLKPLHESWHARIV